MPQKPVFFTTLCSCLSGNLSAQSVGYRTLRCHPEWGSLNTQKRDETFKMTRETLNEASKLSFVSSHLFIPRIKFKLNMNYYSSILHSKALKEFSLKSSTGKFTKTDQIIWISFILRMISFIVVFFPSLHK